MYRIGRFFISLLVLTTPLMLHAKGATDIVTIITYLLLNEKEIPSNQAPVAVSDAYGLSRGGSVSGVNVLDNDYDPDDDAIFVTEFKVLSGTRGDLTISSEGHLAYKASPRGFDTVRIEYVVSDGELVSSAIIVITATPPNRFPTPTPDIYSISEDETLRSVNVLENDRDPDGDSLVARDASASVGSLILTRTGDLEYTPPEEFSGTVTASYIASDGSLGTASEITIEVLASNDPPIAVDDVLFLVENSGDQTIDVLNNDVDVDSADLEIVSASASIGSVTIQNEKLLYVPQSAFTGQDTIAYGIEDTEGLSSTAKVTINIVEPGSSPSLSPGRSVLNVIPYMVAGTDRNTSLDAGNFNNWNIVRETNGFMSISPNGRSATFTRDAENDFDSAFIYAEFDFGPVWQDTQVSVCMDVSGFEQFGSTGAVADNLLVIGSHLSGARMGRVVTNNGTWCTVLDVIENSNTTIVQVGLGVADNDSRTKAITISNVSFSPTDDGLPNEYVKIKPKGESKATQPGGSTGVNGASFNYPKQVNYEESTGLTRFTVPSDTDYRPSAAHVMALFDSFGAFISRSTVRWLYYGLEKTPDYAMTVNARSGRELRDTFESDLLDDMYELPAGAKPGILLIRQASNDLKVNGSSAIETEDYLQWHIDWAHSKGMHVILTTATPFLNSAVWSANKQEQLEIYNSLVRAREGLKGISVIDEYSLLDTNGDMQIDVDIDIPDAIDNGEGFAADDFLHLTNPGYRVLAEAHDSEIRAIRANSKPSSKTVNAKAKPSRTECVSPCTVVFSADATTAQGLDEHGIWSQLIYHWDFDTDESDTYGSLYNQSYTHVEGDTSHEVGGPMATKTFLCEVGTCVYNVGMRAQNAQGEFGDDFVEIIVEAESQRWGAGETVCVSNTLDVLADWALFDKGCPVGAVKMNGLLNAESYGDKLVLLRKGDSFRQNIVTQLGESNFKIGVFGNSSEVKPEVVGKLWIGAKVASGPSDAPDAGSHNIINRDLDSLGTWPENVTIEGIRIGAINLGMSYLHIGMHNLDMDWESSNITEFGRIQLASSNSLCTDSSRLDCSRVPFPKGAYISQVKLVGSETDAGFIPVLNIAGIGCSMINYTGIVDSSMRKVREHNIRLMGWYRLNIMRSALLGHHSSTGRQKITIRSCIEKDVFTDLDKFPDRPDWRERSDLPPNWRQDIEGRTRLDQWFNDSTDDYVHISRYAVIQSNTVGETTLRNKPGSTKIQTNVTSGNEEAQEDVLITKNHFINEIGNTSSTDISMPGFFGACIDNTYSDAGANCTPTTPAARFGRLINPPPLSPPLTPGS